MAVLTDILIASPSEAEAICRDLRHFDRWPCLQYKSIDPIVLSALLVALGADEDAKALTGGSRVLFRDGKEGPSVFHLPDALPTLLANLEDEKIPEIAARWAQGDLSYAGAQISGVEMGLRQLRDFSKQAVKANKPLLLWMCV
jgi:hypothetical protein